MMSGIVRAISDIVLCKAGLSVHRRLVPVYRRLVAVSGKMMRGLKSLASSGVIEA